MLHWTETHRLRRQALGARYWPYILRGNDASTLLWFCFVLILLIRSERTLIQNAPVGAVALLLPFFYRALAGLLPWWVNIDCGLIKLDRGNWHPVITLSQIFDVRIEEVNEAVARFEFRWRVWYRPHIILAVPRALLDDLRQEIAPPAAEPAKLWYTPAPSIGMNPVNLDYDPPGPLDHSVTHTEQGHTFVFRFHPGPLELATRQRILRGHWRITPFIILGACALRIPLNLSVFRSMGSSPKALALSLTLSAVPVLLIGSAFVLVWYNIQWSRIARLAMGRRQYTEIQWDGAVLHITSQGPFGELCADIPDHDLANVAILRYPPSTGDPRLDSKPASKWLMIQRKDGSSLRLLPERERAEYELVRDALLKRTAAR